ncbi:MAG: 30S ribosomal protein S4 [Waddliaceae bacterium]|jgi:small subunit ribosomal protein S4|nr:30S ribosomal protein S4 [Waddliaceae bacterium]MBT3579340.1 30S ribosomal protein S4 [Waddliaceae bacterium]MBT4444830.1 30S ribosomal protein S4 [Waddliaceae bacterium]MBT6928034.1 30S ribosomal protein S4 [Waddliaceae bacterium]MBT7264290.1 30S ribosomal protein S4 [Waddliaceae bacterium]
MARYRGPKNKIARRFQANVFGRARNPMLHKQNPPGMHGARRRKKSDYGLQLEEKQKLKASFGMISEKQLLRYYREAVRREGNTSHTLLEMLESRLDNIVYRLKLAPTILAAHQLVAHGHIQVNGKKVDIRSFLVKPGMEISIREKSRKIACVLNALEGGRDVPEYLSLNKDAFSGTMLATPKYDLVSLPMPVNVAVVCEFLAHTK